MKNFTLDAKSPTTSLYKYWEMCVGSCHATTALREDYRKQLAQCQREIGFRFLRFHGLFDDDMSVLRYDSFEDKLVLSFTNIDNIFDFLLSIQMKPFIELGFMPDCLKSKDTTVFHYKGNTSPPLDYSKWAWFITEFVNHLLERYGRDEVRQWFFEVWNEPNLGGTDISEGFWSGSMEEYFKLYETSARAIKAVDSKLQVGGPATSNNAWIRETAQFCKTNDVPIDFISTHHYPTDVILGYGVEDSQNFVVPPKNKNDPETMKKFKEESSIFHSDLWKKVDRGVLTEMTKKAVKEAQGLPVYYTEWNSLAGLPSDGPFGASFIAKTVMDGIGLVEGYSYWTFSDIFEEGGMPSAEFHGGFGLLTMQGIPKASYRAFELLHQLGDKIYKTKMADGTVDVYAVNKSLSHSLQFVIVNHHSLLHQVETEAVNISVTSLNLPDGAALTADVQRIDDSHANALKSWEAKGKPEYVTQAQVEAIKSDSAIVRESSRIVIHNQTANIELNIPPMGIALVTLFL